MKTTKVLTGDKKVQIQVQARCYDDGGFKCRWTAEIQEILRFIMVVVTLYWFT